MDELNAGIEEMDDVDLFDELEREYPYLADLYNNFMSGVFEEDWIQREYENDEKFKKLVNQAKENEKYYTFLMDMGLL